LAYGAATQGIGAEKRLLSSFLLLPTLLPHHLVPIAWTLSFELFFYICTAAIVLWNRQRADGALVGWCASVILLNALWLATGRYHPDNLGDVSISQWFFFYPLALEFIAGFLLHGWLCRHDGARWQPWAAGAGLFCVVISVYERFGVLHESGLAGFFHACERALLWGGFAVCLVAAAIRMERAGVSPAPWAKALGDASYSIYLGHMLLILVFVSWLSRGPTVPGAHALLFALVLAGMMLVLWLYYIWIERPLYRLATRVLLADPSRDGSLIHRQT
jgi:exopolysaccharide production protein ExoZ